MKATFYFISILFIELLYFIGMRLLFCLFLILNVISIIYKLIFMHFYEGFIFLARKPMILVCFAIVIRKCRVRVVLIIGIVFGLGLIIFIF